jgi:hypothetical protein
VCSNKTLFTKTELVVSWTIICKLQIQSSHVMNSFAALKRRNQPSVVVHAYNSSYLQGCGRKITSSRPALSQNKIKKGLKV